MFFKCIPSFQSQISEFNHNNPNFQAHFCPHYRFRRLDNPFDPEMMCSAAQPRQTRASYLLLVPRLSPTCSSVSTEGMLVPDPCTTLPASASIKRFDPIHLIFFIAAELSWSWAEEPNVHTHPPSRGGEEEEVTAEDASELLWGNYADTNIHFCSIPYF